MQCKYKQSSPSSMASASVDHLHLPLEMICASSLTRIVRVWDTILSYEWTTNLETVPWCFHSHSECARYTLRLQHELCNCRLWELRHHLLPDPDTGHERAAFIIKPTICTWRTTEETWNLTDPCCSSRFSTMPSACGWTAASGLQSSSKTFLPNPKDFQNLCCLKLLSARLVSAPRTARHHQPIHPPHHPRV